MVLGTEKRGRGEREVGGGFIVDPSSSSSSSTTNKATNATSDSHSAREPLMSLSPKQENRLRIYLDERLLELERDQLTRSFISLDNLINRLTPLIHLILQIPAPPPWGSIRISYLLVFTGHLMDYLTCLPLLSSTLHDPESNLDLDDGMEPVSKSTSSATHTTSETSAPLQQPSQDQPSSSSSTATTTSNTTTTATHTTDPHPPPPTSTSSIQPPSSSSSSSSSLIKAKETLETLMDFLNLVERGWCAVLQGKGWIMSNGTDTETGDGIDIRSTSRKRERVSETGEGTGTGTGRTSVREGVQVGSRKGISVSGKKSRKGISVSVAFGAQVDITERTRLRSIVISSREKLIAWARVYGDFKGSGLPGISRSGSSVGSVKQQQQQQQQQLVERGNGQQESELQEEEDTEDEIKVDWEDQVLHTWSGILDMLQEGNDNNDTSPERIETD
ncbi:hypothetical protein BCR39DRAFT_549250 [Naematelia encephala]|uniref:Uncharacterized protein n=1 Tax=Naematelia encephala TaxID=71784 RepID=A0A1Y2AMB3_9TREE|nr:hypothetical protein BCR39DRAFT_549250 [Naematelia encephala]